MGEDMTWRYVSVLHLMQNCKILYYSLYLECWEIPMYWSSANSSWNIKCQHWSLYHLPVLGSLYKSQMFASPVPGWVGCSGWVPPAAASHVLDRSGVWQDLLRELSWGPAQQLLPHRSRCAASPADSVSGTLTWVINETHISHSTGALLLPEHQTPSLILGLILHTIFFQRYTTLTYVRAMIVCCWSFHYFFTVITLR